VSIVQNTYLDWEPVAHGIRCRYPQWSVDTRTEHGAFRDRRGLPAHSCPNEECGHTDRMDRTTVRIVCTSCGVALVMSGEAHDERLTSTQALGYGQGPRRVAGLYLWPGEPLVYGWGATVEDATRDWIVTRTHVRRVRPEDVVGEICTSRGPRGGRQFAALAGPARDGQFGYPHVRYTHAEDGLKSLTAAAKWIAAHPGTTAHGGAEKDTRAPAGGCTGESTSQLAPRGDAHV
jgi:hypothetical protein